MKVGDNVVYIDNLEDHQADYLSIGDVCTIVEKIGPGYFRIINNTIAQKFCHGVFREEFQLVLEEIYNSPLYKALRETDEV